MARLLVSSPSAAMRLDRARRWLAARRADEPLLVVAASVEAASDLVRASIAEPGAAFGWHRVTLGRLAAILAEDAMAEQGLAVAGSLPIEALCARVVHELRGPGLGRFADIADRPGLPRALGRALAELRLAGADERLGDLAQLSRVFGEQLNLAGLADRAVVLRLATEVARGGSHALLGVPALLLDLPIACALDRDFVVALAARAPDLLATAPLGDDRTRAALEQALGVPAVTLDPDEPGSLSRLQQHLFAQAAPPEASLGDEVTILSAPGESRECVELARRILAEAAAGVAFDRMAIALRAPASYRPHLEEALRRARVPAHFAQGTRQPDPAGRAMLALLACAAEGLSARRFAEYLSLGEVPDATSEGRPPLALPSDARWVPPDEELLPDALARAIQQPDGPEVDEDEIVADPEAPVAAGTLRTPRRWEQLLVDAAVIGGLPRWERRLAGLARELALDLGEFEDREDPQAERLRRDIGRLEALRAYALPLLEELSRFPDRALWREWIDRLGALATRSLRHPDRVLSVLAELLPMAAVGPVDLREVRLVLGRRLTDLVVPPRTRRAGHVLVAPIDALRGLAFDVVLVPGLAERIFPQKVVEDPILRDRDRRQIDRGLVTNDDRIAQERLWLRLAIGAARRRLVLSYPRIDLDQSRPRVPSFYGLELLRAGEGRLPGFEDLMRRAEKGGAARIGWPAPVSRTEAVDEAEHDLALLDDILRRPSAETIGAARYLLTANPHLARALRFRARRWLKSWKQADGLVDLTEPGRAALSKHALQARSFSPTALEKYSQCPYQFVLHALHRLAPREEPQAIEQMDPLQRGSLVHEVLFRLLGELRDANLLPVTVATIAAARTRLERVLDEVARSYEDELAPAIERVWSDGISTVRADLLEWLRRAAEDASGWTPWRFELSFGLSGRRAEDPDSRDAAVVLDCGIQLRGSIDLVERNASGSLRVTDHKTGKARVAKGALIFGGAALQPVLYALAVEKIFASAKVEAGRLYYCTFTGGYEERVVPLDAEARAAAMRVAQTIGGAIAEGFLPAAPSKGACQWCDYRAVCGPYEELRTARKPRKPIEPLTKLRSER